VKIRRYIFFGLIILSFLIIVNLESTSNTQSLEELINNNECNSFAYEADYIEITTAYTSQFSTTWQIMSDQSYKNITFKPLYLDSFEAGLACLGKVFLQSNDGPDVYIGVNKPQLEIYKLIVFLINFFILFQLKHLNIYTLTVLNLISAHYINLLFNFDYSFNTNYKFYSPYFELIDSIVISFVLVGMLKKNFHKKISIKLSYKVFSFYFVLYISRLIYILLSDFQFNALVEEWFINYNYGFIRRGFFGSMLYTFSSIFNFDIYILFTLLIISLNSILFYYLYKIFKDRNIGFLEILIFLSPVFLNYSLFWKSTITLPKEILGLVTFLFFIANQEKLKNDTIYLSIFTFLFNISIYSHEINLWFGVGIILILLSKNQMRSFNILFLILIFSMLLLVSLFYLYSNNYNFVSEKLCSEVYLEILKDTNCYKSDVLKSNVSENLNFAKMFISPNLGYYLISYIFYFFISFIPLFIFKSDKANNIIFFSLLLSFIPLFVIAVDWGRWINIFFTIIYLFYLSNVKENKKITQYFDFNPNLQIAFIIMYASFWSVPQCCVTEFSFKYLVNFNIYNLTIYFAILLVAFGGFRSKYKSLNK
tara:strand:+ start:1201 stop:2979 length:1779 start_codon:yes stop_codon:yes gene_type:complete